MNYKNLMFLILAINYSSSSYSHTRQSNELVITDSSFSCIRDMNRVRSLYVSNLLGDNEATIAVAQSKDGGEYPVGSVVQLVPTEVMVKRNKGFNIATKDWEFFELSVSKEGSKIDKRGFADVVNRFGGNCFACHIKAEPKWDLICETGHGCDPIPLTPDMISVIQKTDPRCDKNETLNAKEIKAAGILKKMMGG
jgi:hypothetical protein